MNITDDVLIKLILDANALADTELQAVQEYATSSGIPLSEALLQKNAITDGNLGKLIAAF